MVISRTTFFPTDADDSRSLGPIAFDESTASAVADCLISQQMMGDVVGDGGGGGFDDLGKLDENMMKLLADSMDQQIADPVTEEHLKS